MPSVKILLNNKELLKRRSESFKTFRRMSDAELLGEGKLLWATYRPNLENPKKKNEELDSLPGGP